MKNLIFLVMVLFVFTSCQLLETEQLVTIEDKYSISLPAFLSEAKDLNEEASLQYENGFREFYVLVIDEGKEELQKAISDNDLTDVYSADIEGYSKLLMDNFEQSVSLSKKSEMLDTTINNIPAKLVSFSGKVDGIDIFYSLAFLASEKRYYQIMTWTLANKEDEYKDKMKRIIGSFNELKK